MRAWVLLVALQVVALAVLAHRFMLGEGGSMAGRSKAEICGLLPANEFVLTSRRVVLPEGISPAAVKVKDGVIASIALLTGNASQANLTAAAALKFGLKNILDYGDLIISPGLVDTHVHFNEPGREHWEGFETGTKAAAAGGTTSAVVMPLNALPAIVTADLLEKKVAASKDKLWVDVGFWGGLIPLNAANHSVLQGLLDGGALGFKSFMSPSVDFGTVEESHIRAALPFMRAQGIPYYVHAEIPDATQFQGDIQDHKSWEKSRPPLWEQNAISLLLELAREEQKEAHPGFQIHIAHMSDTGSLSAIAAAKREGVPVTVETCPHYLNFVSEEVPRGDTSYKCAPPLRGSANREAIWQGLMDGIVDSVASDHSPSPLDMKKLAEGDFSLAWGGIAAIQYNLPSTWEGMKSRGLGPEVLSQWWSYAPARIAGLSHRKGSIATGLDADFVVWDPDQLADTSEAALQHKHKLTPYRDRKLAGRVVATYVRGHQVFSGTTLSPQPCGSTLLRNKL